MSGGLPGGAWVRPGLDARFVGEPRAPATGPSAARLFERGFQPSAGLHSHTTFGVDPRAFQPPRANAETVVPDAEGEDVAGGIRWRRTPWAVLAIGALAVATGTTAVSGVFVNKLMHMGLEVGDMASFIGSVEMGTGCSNWADISISGGNYFQTYSSDECASLCKAEGDNCVGFNYKVADGCEDGSGIGACFLWQGACRKVKNPCWHNFETKDSLVNKDWTIQKWGHSCSNWKDMSMGGQLTVEDEDDCGRMCQNEPGCNNFIYQPEPCSQELMGASQGRKCFLLSGVCQRVENVCWNLYEMAKPTPPSGSKLIGHHTWCGNAPQISISNTPLAKADAVDCSESCGENPACKGFSFQQTDYCTSGTSVVEGACFLWNDVCQPVPDDCWSTYSTSAPAPAPASSWLQTGTGVKCDNWESIRLTPAPIMGGDVEGCASSCMHTPGCTGFGYQSATCTVDGDDNKQGGCFLLAGKCTKEGTGCWEEHELTAQPAQAYGFKDAVGCANWKECQIGAVTMEDNFHRCGLRCKMTLGCASFNYQRQPCGQQGVGDGACFLFDRVCEETSDSCWAYGPMLSHAPATSAPTAAPATPAPTATPVAPPATAAPTAKPTEVPLAVRTQLVAAALAGQDQITVDDTTGINANDEVHIFALPNQVRETVTVAQVLASNVLKLTAPMANAHSVGAPVVEKVN